MQKLQTQGLHHITLVGADRQTSIDFWEGLLGMPFIFEQPNLDNAGESHIYFDPGDGRLITVFTREDRKADQAPHADRHRLRPSHRLQRLARRLHAGGRAARRARHPEHRRARPDDLRRDLFRGSARAPDRALVLEVRRARRASPAPTCCSPRTICASRAATARSWRSTSPTRSKASSSRRPRACRRTARPRTHTSAATRPNSSKANRRKPHVCDQAACHQAERQQHDRARVRARGEARFHRGRRLRQDPHRRLLWPRTRRI